MCLRWLVLAALASGCLHDDLVSCGDDLCPAGNACDTDRGICALTNGLSIPKTVAIEHAYCGVLSEGVMTIRNLSSVPVSYDAIISDIGVMVDPASGTFPPGDTDLRISTKVPVDSIAGEVIAGSLFLSTSGDVIKRPLKVTPTGGAFDISTHSLSFGESAVATTTMKTVTYANTGNVGVNLVATLPPATTAFAFASSPMVHLEPGDTRSISVTFESNVVQSYTSSLSVYPDVPLCQPPLDLIPLDGAATTDAILLDSLTLDFADAGCNQAADALPLTITNTNVASQNVALDIKGTDPGMFLTDVGAQTLPGNGTIKSIITRVPTGFTLPGRKTATLGITATLLVTPKSVSLVENIVAPSIALVDDCLDVTDTLIPPHSSISGTAHIVNNGNKTGAVTVTAAPFPVTSISPSQFQIAAQQTSDVVLLISNTSNFYLDVGGLPIATATAINNCGTSLSVIICGEPQ